MAAGTTGARWSRLAVHPARGVVLAFAFVVMVGTGLLMLPAATEPGRDTGVLTALFTATGAISGGLSIVGTGSHWTPFGEVMVLALIQAGGFGIMTLASLLALLVSGRLRLRTQLTTQAETTSLGGGDIRRVLVGIAGSTLAIELTVAAILALRFRLGYRDTVGVALYHGLFYAISAFNNAGFGLRDDNLVDYAQDAWIVLPIAVACILGALGFPVLLELRRRGRAGAVRGGTRHRWSLHTRLTLVTSAVLLVLGTVMTCVLEWGNPGTLGPMPWWDKLLNGFFAAASARTAGFNTVDIGAMEPATLLGICVLMFIGGGSAGTAGGIKVTTFAVLGAAILAEVRGHTAVDIMGRRISAAALRQALTVALVGVGLVVSGTLVLLTVTEETFEAALFEVVSAFGTVGLSTGITGDLPAVGQLVVILLMFAGRLGPISLASALALRRRDRRYTLPEERPVIG
ncbi:TrkH family potassium uptake protein [Streptomyces ipomoeae]|uniref:TrkH family potassium uptake protein n=1 Tax=Streptomyces ipomoeae TaxID=103232 RepID=A0AAE8W354_9ACTN|nr:potassium transporter TrkG [Streptomyces ipomoeae]TQE20931.1 TrkH family potassium uptake protein [Streptomyces ipomoeae]TQE33297.1 TrkH family potassium uptake protein [Streptomyces ipomoeae]